MNLFELMYGKRADAADDLSAAANKKSMKAHESCDTADHQDAGLAHAQAADAHRKKGNFALAQHHEQMMNMHNREAASPDSEGPKSY